MNQAPTLKITHKFHATKMHTALYINVTSSHIDTQKETPVVFMDSAMAKFSMYKQVDKDGRTIPSGIQKHLESLASWEPERRKSNEKEVDYEQLNTIWLVSWGCSTRTDANRMRRRRDEEEIERSAWQPLSLQM